MENTYRDERRDRKRRELQRKRMKQRLMIVGVMAMAVGLVAGAFVGSLGKKDLKNELKTIKEKYEAQSQDVEAVQGEVQTSETDKDVTAELPWNLVLVNPWNEMEEGYEPPELVEIEEDQSVDSRIAEDLKKMLADAEAEGLNPFICSAYRSIERQESLFDSGMKQRMNSGLGYFDAFEKTASVIAVPGTSEHALGLAVDIISVSNTNLDETQEETEEFKWFEENCYKYGFILRYPNGKTDLTGIIYEPWHYRYVGVEVAQEIQSLGVTFEEYIQDYYLK